MRFAPTSIFAPLSLALSLTLVGACGGESPAPAEEQFSVSTPLAVYSVRGVIAGLAPEGQPRDWVAIQHEAIPDFLGFDGEPDPMHSMTMRFPIAETVDLTEAAIGDKVAVDLEIDWDAGEQARVLTVSPLPADTELDLGGM